MSASIDLNKLKTFYLVAKKGSISKASKKLGVSNSAISRSIHLLENTLQTKLFVRRQSKGMELTPEGQFLLGKANDIMKIAIQTERTIKQKQQQRG
jgi:molybdate transport repressor ModE-like protein